MKLEIKKIRLGELKTFVESKAFREMEKVPITPLRARSYVKNPHGKPDDLAIILGFFENQLVAFRTLFAGVANAGNEKIRFGWCSGNWVDPEFRRKGFSEQLLKIAFEEWDGKLMFTNYAPNSEKLYLKTGCFNPIHKFNGVKGYLFPKTTKIFSKTKKQNVLKPFLLIADFIISVVSGIRILFYSKNEKSNLKFESISYPDEQCFSFMKKDQDIQLLERDENDLIWILKYPWISITDQTYQKKYPFSSYSNSFYYKTIKVFNNDEFEGFFIFSVREGHLKTLVFKIKKGNDADVADFLRDFCKKNRIEVITVYNPDIAQHFIKPKFPFLHVKKYGQKIYSSFDINNTSQLHFQDGDGDVIFT